VNEPTQDHGADYDPVIVEYVEHVRDRFGQHGLEGMIALAQRELAATKYAMEQLTRDSEG